MSDKFKVDNDGNCSCCKRCPSPSDHLQCCGCKKLFHVLCPNITAEEKKASKSTITGFLSPSTKDNFIFLCDMCKTKFEVDKATDESQRINMLEDKVGSMAEQISEIHALLKNSVRDDDKNFPKIDNIWKNREQGKK